jgi:hypothetical protein
MRYQSIAYFMELITCYRIFALKNNIYADLAKLESTIGTEYLMGETRRNDLNLTLDKKVDGIINSISS